jgi:lipopolysaccharide export system protein LptC
MNAVRRWALPVLLTLAAALTLWLRDAAERPSESAASARLHLPDYSMEGFELTVMDLNGNPDYRLQATGMRHYQDDGSTEMDAPQLVTFRYGEPPWRATAERGWASARAELVRLMGQVTVHRPAGPSGGEVHIETSELTVRPSEDYAETEQQVAGTMGDHQVQAVGMRLFLAEGRVQLLSGVRGRYVPAR